MFTGIVQGLGRILSADPAAEGVRFVIEPLFAFENLDVGESIAIDGVCLTAEPGSTEARLGFFLSSETLSRTTLHGLRRGDSVNMERSLAAGDRLGGHFVLGHVDAVGKIARLDREGEGWTLEVAYPENLRPYLAPKGSVSVDGISLTTVDVSGSSFTVALIPHTYEVTSLKNKKAGSPVNLEVDAIARYVVSFLSQRFSGSKVDLELLKRAGFQ